MVNARVNNRREADFLELEKNGIPEQNKRPLPRQGPFCVQFFDYTTFTKMITSANSTSDSMKANPRISAS